MLLVPYSIHINVLIQFIGMSFASFSLPRRHRSLEVVGLAIFRTLVVPIPSCTTFELFTLEFPIYLFIFFSIVVNSLLIYCRLDILSEQLVNDCCSNRKFKRSWFDLSHLLTFCN